MSPQVEYRQAENRPWLTSRDVLHAVSTATDRLSVSPAGELMIEACQARELVRRFGSPLFVMSEATLRANYRRIRNAFAAAWPADVNILYAIKCNPNFAVRSVLHSEGAGGDCFGLGELEATFAGGADPDRIALNGSSKSDAVLVRAVDLGIFVNLDNEDEIDRLDRIACAKGRRMRVNIRLKIVPDCYSDYCSDLVNFRGDFRDSLRRMKWGVSSDLAARMISRIRAAQGLRLSGFHTHLGRLSPRPQDRAAYDAAFAQVVVDLYRQTGFAPAVLDIGGGWPRERDPESKSLAANPIPIETYASDSCAALLAPLIAAAMPVPALWVEPGRYIAGNAGVLLTTVAGIKQDVGLTWVHVDASTNIMPLLGAGAEGTTNHVLAATRMLQPLVQSADVVGPICIPSVMSESCDLPRLEASDLIAILDAGMYAESDSHQLNSIPRPATVMVRGSQAAVIRRGETLETLFANQCLPGWLADPDVPATPFRARALAGDA
jgi:diaminopimelate decarboxylase